MNIKVPWLHEEEIEAQAMDVLRQYSGRFGLTLRPPIPVDDLPEELLQVRLEYDDLRKMVGRDDVLGAIWFDKREIYIDQSLDPTDHPRRRPRYRFTVAHEIGHWVLHRRVVLDRAAQLTFLDFLFEDELPEKSILCREANAREPVEWQADRFASYLLMPTELVLQTWKKVRGQSAPWVFDQATYRAAAANGLTGPYDEVARTMMRHVASDLAPKFEVSVEAMQIRLEDMGLLAKAPANQRILL